MQRIIAPIALALTLTGAAGAEGAAEPMTPAAVEALLEEVALEVRGGEENWTALYRETRILVHAVGDFGRMRIMAPVASAGDLEAAELRRMLEANYGRALDAKFAIADGVVWSLFNRPLAGLDRATFVDGLEQVVTLKENYGSSYRSTDLTFGQPPGGS